MTKMVDDAISSKIRAGFTHRFITVNIEARIPHDLDDIISAVDDAYAAKLKQYGASFMLDGAVETRAQESTIELLLADSSATEI
ncbi:MAG: hypothetical protein AB2551_00710 [Candidatus Thiodiazotropha sp.]